MLSPFRDTVTTNFALSTPAAGDMHFASVGLTTVNGVVRVMPLAFPVMLTCLVKEHLAPGSLWRDTGRQKHDAR